MGFNLEKSNIAITILEKLQFLKGTKIIPHFGGNNNIFTDCTLFSGLLSLRKKYTIFRGFTKGVTMSTIFSNPAGSKFISFIWIIENKNFGKIASGEALFPPLVKAKTQLQNFEKHLKQKNAQ